MRELIIDTETTGLSHEKGHRLVEIGVVELVCRAPTGRHYHTYINPKRSMPEDAFRVHGLSEAFLKGFPTFEQIKDDFLGFIGTEDTLVIHNAEFDLGFINAELKRINNPYIIDKSRVIDTLMLARKKFPGVPNNLDALCKRFNISLAQRDKHGALVDAQLLVEIYIELLGGKQGRLLLEESSRDAIIPEDIRSVFKRTKPMEQRVSQEEKEAHARLIESLSGEALWHIEASIQPTGKL